MIDVKLVVSERAMEQIPLKNNTYNPERYRAFVDCFGEGNFGLVSSSGLEKEALTGRLSEVIALDGDLDIIHVENTGARCGLLLASTFEKTNRDHMGLEEIRFIVGYLEDQLNKRYIGRMVNSGRATLLEDKLSSFIVMRDAGIQVIPTYHFKSFEDFKQAVISGNYVLKHRFGEAGKQVLKVNRKNVDSFRDYELEDYILQPELDISNEKRLVFFDDVFLASRVIYDRIRPWEDRETAGRRHQVEKYQPSNQEVVDTRKALCILDSTLGCIDWINVNGERYFLEFNGFGTGLGYNGGPYNLNQIVAEKLKEKYL